MTGEDSKKKSIWILVVDEKTLRTLGVPEKALNSRTGELDCTKGVDIKQPLCRTVYYAFNQVGVDVKEVLDLMFRQCLFSNSQGR